ncbi:hypothetical protein HYPDE_22788 [Hyphomicrobium denitrificans 1NES1]|uniref:Uncharacterized protein n=1 Tax=Hyphomicrobium denitrificans 1NES1 TaxID=670307 RepID=N0AYM5_9HYPH|nr:hypothetical protein HYPDE_22788 [Hyphomicrobium denitrificans 1NES1]
MAAVIEGLPARIKLPRRLLMIGRALPRGLEPKTHSPTVGEEQVLAKDFAVRLSPPGGQNRDTLLGRRSGGAGMGT